MVSVDRAASGVQLAMRETLAVGRSVDRGNGFIGGRETLAERSGSHVSI